MAFASQASLHRCDQCRNFVIQTKDHLARSEKEIANYFSESTGKPHLFSRGWRLANTAAVYEEGSLITNSRMQLSSEKGCVLAQTVLEYAEEAVELRGRSFLLGVSMTAYPAYTRRLVFGAYYTPENRERPNDSPDGGPREVGPSSVCFVAFRSRSTGYWPTVNRDQKELHEVANLDINLEPGSEETQALPYAALADAQGTENTLRLLSSNIEQLGGGMDLADLPPMVQDTVIVAQKLGLSHIWAGLLCIIQDDEVDWRANIAELERIYDNATVTILTSRPTSTEDGFLCRREVELKEPMPPVFEIQCSLGEGVTGDMILAPQVHLVQEGRKSAWQFAGEQFARRRLNYGALMTTWECDNDSKCSSLEFTDGFITRGERSIRQVLGYWDSLVSKFSRFSITVPKERAALLTAIARYYHRLNDKSGPPADECLAGLRKSELPGELLWRRTDEALQPVEYPNPALAPSWSWLAPNSRISSWGVPSHFIDESFVVIDCRIQLVHDDLPWGPVKSGELRVRGFTSNATWHHEHRGASPFSNKVVFGDGEDIPDSEKKLYIQFYNDCTPEEFIIQYPEGPYLDPAIRVPIVLLLVANHEVGAKGYLQGLALRLVEDGRWKRVGYFCIDETLEKYRVAVNKFLQVGVQEFTII